MVAPDRMELTLSLAKPSRSRGHSEYRVALPVKPLRMEELRFRIENSVGPFDRPFELRAEIEGEPVELSAGKLFRKGPATIPLSFVVDPLPVTELLLRVEDGDRPPLQLGSIQARVPTRSLQLTAPGGEYFLWLGGPAGPPPAQVESIPVDAAPAQQGELEPNPLFRVREEKLRLRTAHWMGGALALAAGVGWILSRLPRVRRLRRSSS